MQDRSFENLCIFHVLDGLSDGLSHFSGPSRAALIYALAPDDPLRVYDPQNLLRGHEVKLRELYVENQDWREEILTTGVVKHAEHAPVKAPSLSGLISYAGSSQSAAYQVWFTEHHPDLCSRGPTRRWLEHAVRLLSRDLATQSVMCIGSSSYVLQECGMHAVRDHIVDERNRTMGLDTQLRIYPLLDTILGISKTLEEGVAAQGLLAFVEPGRLEKMDFVVRFPTHEQPFIADYKHVRKLLQATEGDDFYLVSEGLYILGIARGISPPGTLMADFQGRYGFVRLDEKPIASFSDGRYQSGTRKAKLVQLEEILLESDLDPETSHILFQTTLALTHAAQERGYGATIVLDLEHTPRHIPGHHPEVPLDLVRAPMLKLAKSLSRMDGAVHVGADLHLHGFACLLDGKHVPGENLARGARFNSALRFTAGHKKLAVVVVSSDRPASVIQHGVELTARCDWKPLSGCLQTPPLLEEWLEMGL